MYIYVYTHTLMFYEGREVGPGEGRVLGRRRQLPGHQVI